MCKLLSTLLALELIVPAGSWALVSTEMFLVDRRTTTIVETQSRLDVSTTTSKDKQDFIGLLQPGDYLKIRTRDGEVTRGLLVHSNRVQLLLELGNVRGAIHVDEIDTLWERGTAHRLGATIGGIVLGPLAGLVLSLVAPTSGGLRVAAFLDTTVGGGFCGIVIGGVVGSTVPKWHQTYPQ